MVIFAIRMRSLFSATLPRLLAVMSLMKLSSAIPEMPTWLLAVTAVRRQRGRSELDPGHQG